MPITVKIHVSAVETNVDHRNVDTLTGLPAATSIINANDVDNVKTPAKNDI